MGENSDGVQRSETSPNYDRIRSDMLVGRLNSYAPTEFSFSFSLEGLTGRRKIAPGE